MEQTLGKRISANRKRLGMTQDRLAERLGVTPQAVSKWENDQSCPDIATLPVLADIFGITVDELLGKQSSPVRPEREKNDSDGALHVRNGNWEFTYDSGRHVSLGFAVLVLLVGALLLCRQLLGWDVNFWGILWPGALLVFGVFALVKRFSFFRIGCTLFGLYWLLSNLKLLPFSLGAELLLPVLLLLLGGSLMVEAFKKPRKPKFHFGRRQDKHSGTFNHDLKIGEDRFLWSASFGEYTQRIDLQQLVSGEVSTSFGDYTLDLTGVVSVAQECAVSASCSFGELRILIPRRFALQLRNSTAFASVDVHGHHAEEPSGTVCLDADVSFGEISIHYV